MLQHINLSSKFRTRWIMSSIIIIMLRHLNKNDWVRFLYELQRCQSYWQADRSKVAAGLSALLPLGGTGRAGGPAGTTDQQFWERAPSSAGVGGRLVATHWGAAAIAPGDGGATSSTGGLDARCGVTKPGTAPSRSAGDRSWCYAIDRNSVPS